MTEVSHPSSESFLALMYLEQNLVVVYMLVFVHTGGFQSVSVYDVCAAAQ